MNRRVAALAILVALAAAAIVGILRSNGHEPSKENQAKAYCSKEPGLTKIDSPEFQTCVDQYLYRR